MKYFICFCRTIDCSGSTIVKKADREKFGAQKTSEEQRGVRVSLNFLSFPPVPSVFARLLSFPLLAPVFFARLH